jgi:signal transduction histidine kinase/ActR/RegA family two-component response regulator
VKANRQPEKARTQPDTIEMLRARLAEAEETLRAIRSGEVDAIVVSGSNGDRVFALEGADTPYRILVEEMSEGALTIATDGLILYANRRFAKMLDVPLSKVTGSSLLQWVDERARPAMQSLLDEAAAKGESKREFELMRGADAGGADAGGVDASGGMLTGPVPIYLCASCLPDSDPRRLCVVVTDLTEERQHQRLVATQEALKASETRLLAASRLRDEFLATISHELRTPLNAILGWATLLKGGRLAPGKMAEAIEIIERNSRAQVRLVDDLLDVSRVITGKLQLDVRPVAVLPLVQTVLESLRPTFEAKDIKLETDWKRIDGGAVTNGHGASRGAAAPARDRVNGGDVVHAGDMVNGDPDRLQQVIWNLLSNAVKFTPPQGKVCVTLARAATHLELRVADSGLGIKPEFLPHVFERFRQADSTTTRRHSGLGLGLAIVRHLVELHGGTVVVESEGEGRGATFIVRLPVRAVRDRRARRSADAAVLGGARGDAVGVDLHGVTVLVVDDQVDAQALVRTVLQDAGATAIGASAVGDALELMTRFRPDVVVADIGMPGEDGYSLIRQVRERERSRGDRMPAIALTAYGRAEDRALALESGFDAHLRKPVDTEALLLAIAAAVGRAPRHT